MTERPTWRKPRPIAERIFIEGELILTSPAHFGGGDPNPLSHVIMTLPKDPLTDEALLPGASIAGALRNYLWQMEFGYNAEPEKQPEAGKSLSACLFGGLKGDDNGAQSLLIVDDARATIPAVELRDGVRIDAATRTAKDDMLFSMELLPIGTTFRLSFELVLPEKEQAKILTGLTVALQGLTDGKIGLGARKHRGLGNCVVKNWRIKRYRIKDKNQFIDWLTHQDCQLAPVEKSLTDVLSNEQLSDKRQQFALSATFAIDGSVLVRSGFGSLAGSPDVAHLHVLKYENGKMTRVPIVPGTSLAGVIRHRALRIANTLYRNEVAANSLVDGMFGHGNEDDTEKELTSSRVIVEDAEIISPNSMVQTRVTIDRFTGGAFETALINEEPVWGTKDTRLTINLELRNPQPAEIGLLMLVLKDLWTGDLPVGGKAVSVGGGCVAKKPDLKYNNETWGLRRQGNNNELEVTSSENARDLQKFINALSGGDDETKN